MSTTVEHLQSAAGLPIALLRLDDGKANAFNPTMLASLAAALDAIDRSDARALVVAGRPGFFSGGLDLKALPGLSAAEKSEVMHRFGEVLLRLFTFRTPTVAALTGHAIAGGALFALGTDVRVAVDLPARFGITEIALGLPVPSFGLLVAKSAMAPSVVTDLVLQARVVNLRETVSLGFVRSLHPEDALLEGALALAGDLARLPGLAHQTTKRTLWAADIERVVAGMEAEIEGFVRLFEERFPR